MKTRTAIATSLVALSLAVASCSGASGFSSDSKAEKKDEKKVVETKDDGKPEDLGAAEEEASVPLIVAGAYLLCDDAAVPTGKDAELAVGCRLANKTDGKNVDFDRITKAPPKWTSGSAEKDGVAVAVDIPATAGETDPQALFLFTGGDASSRRAVADGAEAQLSLDLKENVSDFKGYAVAIKDAKPGEANKTKTSGPSAQAPASTTTPPVKDVTEPAEEGIITTDDPSLPPGEDLDKDTVNNGDDRCDNTPVGANIWTAAKVTASGNPDNSRWLGCSGGQYSSDDDSDLDGVPNVYDRCDATPKSEVINVDIGAASARRGCAPSETPAAS